MICVDVGSGYNPKKGYLTVDVNYGCDYYSIKEIPDDYVDKFHIRNVLHHIKELNEFASIIYLKQKKYGELNIIDCNKENYNKNYFLDTLWYRYIFCRKDIYISNRYRDLISPFIDVGYSLIEKKLKNEKIFITLKKDSHDTKN